jgi:hypothetical protein
VLAAALLFLVSCGKHSFEDVFDSDIDVFSSSSNVEEPSSSSNVEEPSSSSNVEELSSSSNGNGTTPGIVGPLIKTRWRGRSPFNDLVPMDGDTRSAAGCVAFAMAQIMNYHRYPVRGIGQRESYTTTGGIVVPAVNFEVDYDWNNMLDTYPTATSGTEQQRNAVATLIYHAGASVRMSYSANSSSPIGLTAGAFVNFFGYDRSIQWLRRSYFDNEAEWEAIIREQLDAGLPVMYSGVNASGGSHRFIIDGYDNEGRFHMNGGGGSSDGWFYLNSYSYRYNQGMHINIKPNENKGNSEILALDAFTVDNHSVPRNESFKVNVMLRGIGIFSGGHVGAALVNNSGDIEAIVGIRNTGGRPAGDVTSSIEIFCNIPESINPGQYSLRIITRPTDGEWRIVTLSLVNDGVPSSIDFTVTPAQSVTPGGGYGLVLEGFSPEKTSVQHGEQFNVSVQLRNRSDERFPGGQFGAALLDNSGNIVKVIGTRNYGGLGANSYTTGTITINNCSVTNDVLPGQYRLSIVVASPVGASWRIANMSIAGVPNSIDFTVE